MPIFFQQQINENTRLGVWKIEESEEFFKGNVPQHRDVTHPHKRLQHLAGRFLLQYLFPDFPYELIQIADTRKPFLPDAQYHFSISHCGDYAAAIVSKESRVGIDVEIPVEKIEKIMYKFLSEKELDRFSLVPDVGQADEVDNFNEVTTLWSAKEAVFKWYGDGGVDFRKQIQLLNRNDENKTIDCFFSKSESELVVNYKQFDGLVLAWVVS
ncbi:MAG: 4'-phosphopantetheinyl transferase superfamily protein [Chitinophagaceae bacterium]|nr:4'-phosphopantetheinyl transferase superfamily protein [Chitinophagaceae bacterium]MBP9102251.1 4'-phosphopantetheinyl transferase superfamily protein [Chitinophagaceae bacterium]